MAKIFISHASEDKELVARPLAEELRLRHDVWFDESEIKMGDSILGKINEGLNHCDYGIVIFSPSFFAKKWPKMELDGLLALEETNGKIILPIWHKVSKAEVAKHSAIFAGRLSADFSKGLDNVIHEIEIAVSGAQRTRELLVAQRGRDALRKVTRQLKNAAFETEFFRTEDGAGAVIQNAREILGIIGSALQADGGGRFGWQLIRPYLAGITGPYGMRAFVGIRMLCSNAGGANVLGYKLEMPSDPLSDEYYVVDEDAWHPHATSPSDITWQSEMSDDALLLTREAVADNVLGRFAAEIERQHKERADR